MKRSIKVFLAVAGLATVVAVLASQRIDVGYAPVMAQVAAGTARCPQQPFYGRTDGWCTMVSDYSGSFYVNGTAVATISAAGAFTPANGLVSADDDEIYFGTSSDAAIVYEAAKQAPDTLAVGTSTDSEQLLVAQLADVTGTDLTVAARTNPTINIHSADAATAGDYLLLSHDQTRAALESGTGTFVMAGVGNTNNESLTFDFETTANSCEVGTGTGVTKVDFGTMNLETDELSADGTGTLTTTINGENLICTATANTLTYTTGTSVDTVDFGAIVVEMAKLRATGVGTLTLHTGDPSTGEDLVMTASANAIALSSSTGVTSLSFSGLAPSFTAVSAGNQSCVTTCGISKPVAAYDSGGATFVATDSATADTCLCTGPAA